MTTQQEHLVKLMKFTRIKSSHFQDKYYLQNLYEATFLMDDQKTNTFVVWIDESEVYRHANFCTYVRLQCMKLTITVQ